MSFPLSEEISFHHHSILWNLCEGLKANSFILSDSPHCWPDHTPRSHSNGYFDFTMTHLYYNKETVLIRVSIINCNVIVFGFTDSGSVFYVSRWNELRSNDWISYALTIHKKNEFKRRFIEPLVDKLRHGETSNICNTKLETLRQKWNREKIFPDSFDYDISLEFDEFCYTESEESSDEMEESCTKEDELQSGNSQAEGGDVGWKYYSDGEDTVKLMGKLNISC